MWLTKGFLNGLCISQHGEDFPSLLCGPLPLSSAEKLDFGDSVETRISRLESSIGFRLQEFALENSFVHSQLIPFPGYFWGEGSRLMEGSHFCRRWFQFPISAGVLSGGQCAVLFSGKVFCTETMKFYFVFLKIWKELYSLKPAFGLKSK